MFSQSSRSPIQLLELLNHLHLASVINEIVSFLFYYGNYFTHNLRIVRIKNVFGKNVHLLKVP